MMKNKKVEANLSMVVSKTFSGLNMNALKYLLPVWVSPLSGVTLRCVFAAIAFWIIGMFVKPETSTRKEKIFLFLLGALGIYAEIVAMEEHDITINWKPIDGLVIVSDKSDDFDFDNDTSKNVNVWDDYNVYSGILKTYHSETGYKDVVFKYGSLIAVKTEKTRCRCSF